MISKGHLLGKQEDNIAKDDFSMSLTITIISIFAAWMAVALAMLWGLLRVARRHQPVAPGRDAYGDPLDREAAESTPLC